ncbi:hypothetical protein [Streptomyces coeruleorubidus]|uniref:hypothetical protein n=1 Tax=Streptomyces coeruleorubidus TaxID=116188 RepID=UPI00142F1F87|nr:hypothetical protein [Streptomyces coeruleorubidus]GGT67830.1 hypothetical protein GCM10010256_27330 [Streptomyces coeruleorubidus]
MRRAFATRFAAAVIITATAAGCTASATTGPSGNSGSSSTGQGRDLTDAEQVVVERAEGLLTKKCMASRGFSYWVGPIASVDERKTAVYVLDDLAWVRKHGYGGRLVRAAERAGNPNFAYSNAFPREDRVRYTRALEGMPSDTVSVELPRGGTVEGPAGGCRAEAQGELYGDHETWFRVSTITENLAPLFLPDLMKDKRFVHALASWSSCMRKKGHDYRSPEHLRLELARSTDAMSDGKAHAVEVELATAEAVCAGEDASGLAATARDLEHEYRAKKLGPYADTIATHQRLSLAALARAEDITGAAS